ncbi:MAG: lipopolysaccharide assembly protein LapB [Burkholderiaceae bacterium]|nr:lipopolysaccharide assembly protein LapB [Burkholderiaceae bacterium]
MDSDLWWLVAVPLSFGAGWLAARLESRSAQARTDALPAAYFRGLNLLLDEQHEQAIDEFVNIVRLEPETVALHFALGKLFRNRGETDRAIRVHQNLIGRSDLDAEQRVKALHELGQDYLKAGLIDRADETFQRLAGSSFGARALVQRLQIAQSVRDWPLAIELAQQSQLAEGVDRASEIAHCYCELAQAALERCTSEPDQRAHHLAQARAAIDAARSADAAHPRSWLLLGQLGEIESDPAATLAAWQTMAQVGPAYLALVAREFVAAHETLGRLAEALEQLEAIAARHPSVDIFGAILDARAKRDGAKAALEWGRGALQAAPSILGYDRLTELRLAAEPSETERGEYELTRVLLRAQVRRLSRYQCGHCGFKARRFYWQCPGCNRWDSYAPLRSEELERG